MWGSSKCGIYTTDTNGGEPTPATSLTADIPTGNQGNLVVFTSKGGQFIMQPSTREVRFQRLRAAVFVVAAVLLLLLSGLYAAESLKAADAPNETVPPYSTFTGQATPNQGVQAKAVIDVVLTILPRTEITPYFTTLRITSTVPEQFTIISGSLSASTMQTLPLLIDSRIVTWTANFTSLVASAPITIGYKIAAPSCYVFAPPAAEAQSASASSRSLAIQSSLQELTNPEVSQEGRIDAIATAIDWTGPDCGTYLPYVRLQPTPTPTATPIPVFPTLINGNFENGSSGPDVGWRQAPSLLVFSTAALPPAVRSGVQGNYAAWLGGVNNSNDKLSQTVVIPPIYSAKLKLRYYTTSDESTCGADTAAVYISSPNNKGQKLYALCKAGATNRWVADTIDLKGFSGEVTLLFESRLNGTQNSQWFLDDISLCNAAEVTCK